MSNIRRFKIRSWIHGHAKALQSIAYIPRYLAEEDRHYIPPSVPSLMLGERVAGSIVKWQWPEVWCNVCDGHSENYGYPRHLLYLVFWWNRRAYAFGVYYIVPTPTQP